MSTLRADEIREGDVISFDAPRIPSPTEGMDYRYFPGGLLHEGARRQQITSRVSGVSRHPGGRVSLHTEAKILVPANAEDRITVLWRSP